MEFEVVRRIVCTSKAVIEHIPNPTGMRVKYKPCTEAARLKTS